MTRTRLFITSFIVTYLIGIAVYVIHFRPQ